MSGFLCFTSQSSRSGGSRILAPVRRRKRACAGPAVPGEAASEAATTRMSLYLRALARCEADGISVVSSDGLASAAGCKSALVRKDLAHFGQFGVRGVGYEVRVLRTRIRRIFGLERDLPVVIVGAGHLGMALAGYLGFNSRGFRTIALFDVDSRKISRTSRT